jgi:hypothetical protein
MSNDDMKKWMKLMESPSPTSAPAESDDFNSHLAKEWRSTRFENFLSENMFPTAAPELDLKVDLIKDKWVSAGEIDLAKYGQLGPFALFMDQCVAKVFIGASSDHSVLHLRIEMNWIYHGGGKNGTTATYMARIDKDNSGEFELR